LKNSGSAIWGFKVASALSLASSLITSGIISVLAFLFLIQTYFLPPMSVDYDLVVIGSSVAGIEAAIAAAHLKARVALVTQSLAPLHKAEAAFHSLLHLGHEREQWQRLQHSPFWSAPDLSTSPLQWGAIQSWMNLVATDLEAFHSAAVLASLGIDVIPDLGEFCRKPSPGFTVGGRFLSARGYLLATGTQPQIPDIAGLKQTGYLTMETLPYHLSRWQQGQHLVVLGQGGDAIALAQTLNRLNFTVTLLASTPHLLPTGDMELVRHLQAQLTAAGIRILTNVEG
jgi:pyruvate/2-oxoglutarate dehydrogenase complex dihydrolipoamide dehydrogenase (E3) component